MQIKTPRDMLLELGLDRIVEANPDHLSASAGYFIGSIRAYVDEITYLTNKGGSTMRQDILKYTERIRIIFAYQDQLREEYETAMLKAYDRLYKGGGD